MSQAPRGQPFRFFTDEEAQDEAIRRLVALQGEAGPPNTTKAGYGCAGLIGAALLASAVAQAAPTLSALLMLAGAVGGYVGLKALMDQSAGLGNTGKAHPDAVRGLTTTLRGSLRGKCPACEQEIILRPAGTSFTVHCPLCGAPLRYDRGVTYLDR